MVNPIVLVPARMSSTRLPGKPLADIWGEPMIVHVWRRAMEEGLCEIFKAAGALISNAGCAGCAAGQVGQNGPGEVTVSTGNRNFPGKQGKGPVYLASPAVVAASCVRGEICAPEDL